MAQILIIQGVPPTMSSTATLGKRKLGMVSRVLMVMVYGLMVLTSIILKNTHIMCFLKRLKQNIINFDNIKKICRKSLHIFSFDPSVKDWSERLKNVHICGIIYLINKNLQSG